MLNNRGRVQFDARRFLSQSSFNLSLTDLARKVRERGDDSPGEAGRCAGCETGPVRAIPEPAGRWSLWGRGAMTSFSSADDRINLSGDVLTGLVGMDYARARWLAGVSLAWHDGDGSYSANRNGDAGSLDSTLVTLNPYLRYTLNDRLSAWGTLGYGTGELRLRRGGPGPEEVIETDLGLGMGAAGLRGVVYAGAETELALKTDALWVRTTSAETEGMAGAGADTGRLRLALAGRRQWTLAGGAQLSPSFELAGRYDTGDAETGFGMELGGGLKFANAVPGLAVETKARILLAHEDTGYEEWGLSGSVALDPGGLGRGLALRVDSGWGAAESGAEAMWRRQTTAGIAQPRGQDARGRVAAELAYGLDVPWTNGILTPYSGLEWAGEGRTLRLGWRFTRGQHLSLSLEGERQENGHAPPEHVLMLRTSLPW